MNTINYIKTKKFYLDFFIIFILITHLFLIIKNFSFIYSALEIGVPFFDSLSTIYDFKNTFTLNSFSILLVTFIISSFNLALLFKYLKIQKKAQNLSSKNNEGKKMGLALTLAYLASHCASCGVAIFGGLISASFLTFLPFAGAELGIIGILILIFVSYDIIKKLNNPYVC